MFSSRFTFSILVVAGGMTISGAADAHVGLASRSAPANTNQKITFTVGHGCVDADDNHLDTVKIKVTVPPELTSVRGLRSDFGPPRLIKSGEVVTHVEWTKPTADLLSDDSGYYEITLRARTPDAAFSSLQLNVEQTCENATTHEQIVVNWDQPADSAENTAPVLNVTPAHVAGWNKITIATAVAQDKISAYLGDAVIVWRGTQAYSSSSVTTELIAGTDGVTPLTGGLAVGDELWVRY